MSFENPDQSALNEFAEILQNLKENHPAAFEVYKSQITDLVHMVSDASGIGPNIKRIKSSFLAPQRAYSELLFNQLEKALGPLTNDMRYFLTSVSMEIEDFLLDNVVGAGIGGIIGGIMGYFIGHPILGAMVGSGIGAGVQQGVSGGITPLRPPMMPGGYPFWGDEWFGGDTGSGREHDRDLPPLLHNAQDISVFDQLRGANQLSVVTKAQIVKYRLHNIRM